MDQNYQKLIKTHIKGDYYKGTYMGIEVIYKYNKQANAYYVNAPKLITTFDNNYKSNQGQGKKDYSHWETNDSTKQYIADVKEELNGLEICEKPNGLSNDLKGTYIHQELLPFFLQWISRKFQRTVSKIMDQIAIQIASNPELNGLTHEQVCNKIDGYKIEISDLKNKLSFEEQKVDMFTKTLMEINNKYSSIQESNFKMQNTLENVQKLCKTTVVKLDSYHQYNKSLVQSNMIKDSQTDSNQKIFIFEITWNDNDQVLLESQICIGNNTSYNTKIKKLKETNNELQISQEHEFDLDRKWFKDRNIMKRIKSLGIKRKYIQSNYVDICTAIDLQQRHDHMCKMNLLQQIKDEVPKDFILFAGTRQDTDKSYLYFRQMPQEYKESFEFDTDTQWIMHILNLNTEKRANDLGQEHPIIFSKFFYLNDLRKSTLIQIFKNKYQNQLSELTVDLVKFDIENIENLEYYNGFLPNELTIYVVRAIDLFNVTWSTELTQI